MNIITGAATTWTTDLLLLREHMMTPDTFFTRHIGIIRSMGRWWANRCPERVDIDDIVQEVRLEIWRAVADWDPARSVPINLYVRRQVRERLSGLVKQHIAARNRDARWVAAMGKRDESAADESLVPGDDAWDAKCFVRRTAGYLVGRRNEVFLRVVDGQQTADFCQALYPDRTFGGALKEARLAVEQAYQIVTSLQQ